MGTGDLPGWCHVEKSSAQRSIFWFKHCTDSLLLVVSEDRQGQGQQLQMNGNYNKGIANLNVGAQRSENKVAFTIVTATTDTFEVLLLDKPIPFKEFLENLPQSQPVP